MCSSKCLSPAFNLPSFNVPVSVLAHRNACPQLSLRPPVVCGCMRSWGCECLSRAFSVCPVSLCACRRACVCMCMGGGGRVGTCLRWFALVARPRVPSWLLHSHFVCFFFPRFKTCPVCPLFCKLTKDKEPDPATTAQATVHCCSPFPRSM